MKLQRGGHAIRLFKVCAVPVRDGLLKEYCMREFESSTNAHLPDTEAFERMFTHVAMPTTKLEDLTAPEREEAELWRHWEQKISRLTAVSRKGAHSFNKRSPASRVERVAE